MSHLHDAMMYTAKVTWHFNHKTDLQFMHGILAIHCHVLASLQSCLIGGYMACGILLIQSANENRNGIPLNRILFNGIWFPFVFVKAYLPASVNCWQR